MEYGRLSVPPLKTIKVKKWKVRVWQDHILAGRDYVVYATSGWDARVLAFAIDGGFHGLLEMKAGDAILSGAHTKIVAST